MHQNARPVHVVVLAAGRGSRLGDRGRGPKWLLEVGGRTIAHRHLEAVERADGAGIVGSASVVVGHAAQDVTRALIDAPVAVRVVDNPEFAELNNWWSLLRALRLLPPEGPVVVVNSDLLVAPDDLAAFLEAAAECDEDGLLCVDLARELTPESMKVARAGDGTLARIGKAGIDDAAGEYIGLLMARGPVLADLRAALEAFVGREDARNEWYEGAVGATAAAGARWHIWPMPSTGWVEIDDLGDLESAEGLLVGG